MLTALTPGLPDLLSLTLLAMFIDLALGGPLWLGRIPGPETGIRLLLILIVRLTTQLGRAPAIRRLVGLVVLVGAMAVSALLGWYLETSARNEAVAFCVQLLILTLMIGQRNAWDTLRKVRDLIASSHEDAHARDRAALWSIERLVNRYADGFVANLFYYLLFGMAGLFVYRVPAVMAAIGSGQGYARPKGAFYDAPTWAYQALGLVPAAIASLLMRAVAFLLKARPQPLPKPPSRQGDLWIRLWPFQAVGAALGVATSQEGGKVPPLGVVHLRQALTLIVLAWHGILITLLLIRVLLFLQ